MRPSPHRRKDWLLPGSNMNVSTLHIGPRGRISPYSHLCLCSFARRGYSVNLYTYNQDLELPTFVTPRDASEILPENRVFENVRERGSFGMFSNLFRYHLLSQVDTIWIDMDVILVADRLPEEQFLYGWEDAHQRILNTAVLKAPRNSPLLAKLIQECCGDPDTLVWGIWGPRLFTRVVQAMDLARHAQPTSALYPVGWLDALAAFAPSLRNEVKAASVGSATFHLWNEILRRYLSGYPQSAPPRGSFLADLVEEWKLSHLFGTALTEDDLQKAESTLLASHPNAIARRRFPLR